MRDKGREREEMGERERVEEGGRVRERLGGGEREKWEVRAGKGVGE